MEDPKVEELSIEELVELARLVPASSWIHTHSDPGLSYGSNWDEYIAQIYDVNIFLREQESPGRVACLHYDYSIRTESAKGSNHLGADSSRPGYCRDNEREKNKRLLASLYNEILYKRGSAAENPPEFNREQAILAIRTRIQKSRISNEVQMQG